MEAVVVGSGDRVDDAGLVFELRGPAVGAEMGAVVIQKLSGCARLPRRGGRTWRGRSIRDPSQAAYTTPSGPGQWRCRAMASTPA